MYDVFKIEESENNMKLSLKGRINATTADYLIANVLYKIEGTKHLYLDIREVEYISSTGLRFVLMLQNKIDDVDGEMTVSSCNDIVRETFDLTGFSDFLNWDV